VNTILLATDGSVSAGAATHEAVELAEATGWPLHLLTVWDVPTVAAYGYEPGAHVPLQEMAEAEETHAGEVVQRAVETASRAGVTATSSTRRGFPPTEICAAAEELDAKLIVMGAHGWGALKRFIFGSVSNGVLHNAPCPVLVVRMEADEGELVAE